MVIRTMESLLVPVIVATVVTIVAVLIVAAATVNCLDTLGYVVNVYPNYPLIHKSYSVMLNCSKYCCWLKRFIHVM